MKTNALAAIVAIGLVAGVIYWRESRPITAPAPSSPPSEVPASPPPAPDAEVQAMARLAVGHAHGLGITLDYSEGSIQDVERALGRLHDEITAERISRNQAMTLARQYGAYVGQTMRRRWGGSWSRDHETVGPSSFPLRVKGLDVFPLTWCMKRVDFGPEDNVWNKYQVGVVSPPSELWEGEQEPTPAGPPATR